MHFIHRNNTLAKTWLVLTDPYHIHISSEHDSDTLVQSQHKDRQEGKKTAFRGR